MNLDNFYFRNNVRFDDTRIYTVDEATEKAKTFQKDLKANESVDFVCYTMKTRKNILKDPVFCHITKDVIVTNKEISRDSHISESTFLFYNVYPNHPIINKLMLAKDTKLNSIYHEEVFGEVSGHAENLIFGKTNSHASNNIFSHNYLTNNLDFTIYNEKIERSIKIKNIKFESDKIIFSLKGNMHTAFEMDYEGNVLFLKFNNKFKKTYDIKDLVHYNNNLNSYDQVLQHINEAFDLYKLNTDNTVKFLEIKKLFEDQLLFARNLIKQQSLLIELSTYENELVDFFKTRILPDESNVFLTEQEKKELTTFTTYPSYSNQQKHECLNFMAFKKHIPKKEMIDNICELMEKEHAMTQDLAEKILPKKTKSIKLRSV